MSFRRDREPAKLGKASRTLVSARQHYLKQDYYTATILAYKVLSKQTSDSTTGIQQAQLLMVKALYKLKFYAAALAYAQRILQGKAFHRYRSATVHWLIMLARVLPHAATNLPKRLNVNIPTLRGVRDELLLLMARRALKKGSFAFAISYARRVSNSSPHHAPARLVHWEALWRTRKLVAASKVLRSGFLKGSRFEAKANLELARMLWRSKDIARARRLFNHAMAVAKKGSPIYAVAAFERSMMRLHQRGKLWRLRSIRPQDLRRIVYGVFCARGPRPDAFAVYRTAKLSPQLETKRLLAQHQDDADMYTFAQNGFGKKTPAIPKTLMKLSLRDTYVRRALALTAELDKELKLHSASDKAWQTTAIASEVLQELALQGVLARADAGKIIRQRIQNILRAVRILRRAIGARNARIPISNGSKRGFHALKSACPK